MGGFLSVCIGINKLSIDMDSDWRVNAISGASRVVISIIGSILVYMAIVSRLFLANFSLQDSAAGIYTLSIAAGFSETFVPNILRQLPSDGRSAGDAIDHRSDQGPIAHN
jgi:hypothetical protein